MDAIDILGGLLGGKSGGSGLGGKILKDILGGSGQRRPTPTPRGGTTRNSAPSREVSPRDIESQARELEDLLNIAKDRHAQRPSPAAVPRQAAPMPRAAPPAPSPYGRHGGIPQPAREQNDRAAILIRAMVNATKADGRVTQEEQEKIFAQLGDTSRAAVDYLRSEFAQPLDVREFAWTVPLGMEEQVYLMSLMAIDLDTDSESQYLKELAHGLRLSPHECDRLHDQVGAPPQHR